jgi:signal transduction histidine kinase
VTARAGPDPAADDVRILATATGVGIPIDRPPELLPKLSQDSDSDARRRPGTGLGLTITKELVEGMGGSIVVESEGPNRGTRVRLSFPPCELERRAEHWAATTESSS